MDQFIYARAKAVVLGSGNGSTSHLARRLRLHHSEALELMEKLEREDLVTAPDSKGRRVVLRPANDRI